MTQTARKTLQDPEGRFAHFIEPVARAHGCRLVQVRIGGSQAGSGNALEIFLEKGHLVINGLKTPSGTYGDEVLTVEHNLAEPPETRWDEPQTFSFPIDRSWNSEIEYFFNAIRTGHRTELGNSSDALKLMQVIDKIYKQPLYEPPT